ncbi:MAG: S8 family peptidase [Bacteroidota bacterium]|nr:S8 family peptidase [Bacteroidota bacterium]
MVKRIVYLSLMMLTFVNLTLAQQRTNVAALQGISKRLSDDWSANYQKAIGLAKQNGWALRREAPHGRLIVLNGVDALGNPKYLTTFNNTIAAATTGANQLWAGGTSGLNLSGSSAAVKGKLAIWDGGSALTTHVEFGSRIWVKDSASVNDHATHTSGTLIAAGVNPIAKGMAYGAQQLIAYDYTNDQAEMSNEAANLLISNHSYGYLAGWDYDGTNWSWYGDTTINASNSYAFGYYDASAQTYDNIAFNAPYYLIVMSAGNSRSTTGPAVGSTYLYNGNTNKKVYRTATISNNPDYGSVAWTQTAKNILSVGAVQGLSTGYSKPSDVVMSSFSCWGPTDDGRIKPDVVADGVAVTSSSSSSTTAYETLSGTSMASPNAAGSLYLLQEYYNQLHPGVFMRSATLKGLAIHTADEAGSYPGPDYQFGWGLLDVLKGSNVIKNSAAAVSAAAKTDTIIESTLNNGATYSFTAVASGNGVLTATLSWTDPAANPIAESLSYNNTTPRLINDLDIRITSGSSTYKPWILTPTVPAAAATHGDNTLDNVEKIQVDSVVPGQTYVITVSHKGTLQNNMQAFSLIMSGIGGTAYCTSSGSSSTTGAKIDSVVFAGIANKNISSAPYNNYTNITASIQPAQIIPIKVSVNTRDASSNPRVVKVFIDYNNNGSFEAGELVGTSNVINGSTGVYSANITTPASVNIGNYTLMRVIVQETSDPTTVNACGTYAVGETEDFRVQFVNPSNDLGISEVIAPAIGNCSNTSQFLVVRIKNYGSVNKSNVPVTATIKNGTTTVASLSAVYSDTVYAGSDVVYMFQTTFPTSAATTYTITANTNDPTDQNKKNDTISASVTIMPKPSTPSGLAEICGSSVLLRAKSANTANNYFWYGSSGSSNPIATGSSASTSVITSDKNYYLSTGFNGSIGPLNKNVLGGGSGGYFNYSGNFVNISATTPVVIDAAKLYIRYPGKLTFAVVDISNVQTAADGSISYSYSILSSTTIDAYATSPNPIAPSSTGTTPNDPSDSGAYFYLNLPVPAGSHAIIINPNTSVQTSIFRNSSTTMSNTYPITIPGVFSITGNSAQYSTSVNYQNYYYFFYDMKLRTTDCQSDQVTIAASTAPTPSITKVGDSLASSSSSGNQWYFNGSAISGATSANYKPTQSGNYSVIVTDSLGCQRGSANYSFVYTALQNVNASEIGLTVSPNPSSDHFTVRFTMNQRANVAVQLVNAQGQAITNNQYANFSGNFNQQYSCSGLSAGTYIVRVLQDSKVYHQKIIVVR